MADPFAGAPIRLDGVADQIKNVIRELILEERLRPGDKLPSEDQLVERFSVSNC